MRYIIFIFLIFVLQTIFAQDSSMVKPKFNYVEFNVNSANYYNFYTGKLNSFNSINIGLKAGLFKLSIGAEYAPNANSGSPLLPTRDVSTPDFYDINIKTNLFIYFSKKQKKVNPFTLLNFNTQSVKDYIDYDLNYRIVKGTAYGLGYGAAFYIKKRFIIEPSVLINLLFYKNKNIYKTTTFLTTTYTEEIKTNGNSFIGISLKLGYIINFKNKTK